MDWRKGIKLIIHIADDGAHGEEFTKGDKHSKEGIKLTSLIQECKNVQKEILILWDLKLMKSQHNHLKK